MSFDEKLIFSTRLRHERERLGLMQKEMAQKLDIPPNTYNGYETGKRSPNLEVAKHISDTLDISVDYLLGRTNERNLKKEKTKLDESIKTIAAHRVNPYEDISEEGINKINEYIEMIRIMEQNKK